MIIELLIFYKFISFHLMNHDGLGSFDFIFYKNSSLVLLAAATQKNPNEMKLSVSSLTCIIIDNVFNR